MYAHLQASTGMSWQQVRNELDFPAVIALNDYWREHPPAHELIRMYVGYKAPPKPVPKTADEQMQELMALIDNGGF